MPKSPLGHEDRGALHRVGGHASQSVIWRNRPVLGGEGAASRPATARRHGARAITASPCGTRRHGPRLPEPRGTVRSTGASRELVSRHQGWTRARRDLRANRAAPNAPWRGRPVLSTASRAAAAPVGRVGSVAPDRAPPRVAAIGARGPRGPPLRAPVGASAGAGRPATVGGVAKSRPNAAGSGGRIRAGVALPARGESGASGRAFSLARTLS